MNLLPAFEYNFPSENSISPLFTLSMTNHLHPQCNFLFKGIVYTKLPDLIFSLSVLMGLKVCLPLFILQVLFFFLLVLNFSKHIYNWRIQLFKVTQPVISTTGSKTQFSPLYFHSTIPTYYDGDTGIVFILVNTGSDSQCLSQTFG